MSQPLDDRRATPEDVHEFRAAWHLSQSELARWIGVSPLTVSRWERGAQPILQARMLAVTLTYLEERFRRRQRQRRLRAARRIRRYGATPAS